MRDKNEVLNGQVAGECCAKLEEREVRREVEGGKGTERKVPVPRVVYLSGGYPNRSEPAHTFRRLSFRPRPSHA